MQFIQSTQEERDIVKHIPSRCNSDKGDYLNKIYTKPWGYEYLTYQTEKLGIWILHLCKNQKTSLHCHFKKDSMLIVLSGTFRIDTYDDFYILNENQVMYFPAKVFHGIMSYSENGVILEIEVYSNEVSYSDKNDLLRLRDMYNRDKDTYEGSVVETDVSDEIAVNFHSKPNFTFGDSRIHIKTVKKYENNNSYCSSDRNIRRVLLDGKIVSNNILSPGSIINWSDNYKLIDTECTIMEIENIYSEENAKIIHSKEQLIDLMKNTAFNNTGLTSGCFDILHTGHIHNLKRCKSKCDTLFVCLSSDKQIRELKGETRPVNNIAYRIRMLSHMKFIDYIILYEEIDSHTEKELDNIMNIINPDTWFKGSDYDESVIRKKHPILKNICLLNNVPNVSTTIIINRAGQRNDPVANKI